MCDCVKVCWVLTKLIGKTNESLRPINGFNMSKSNTNVIAYGETDQRAVFDDSSCSGRPQEGMGEREW